jgi:heme O synthase-like polyprenyltransferase
MLAAMTLVLAAPAFNGLFYATAATIIPVLFLALAVQGATYRDLMAAAQAARKRYARRASYQSGNGWQTCL